MTMMMIMMTMIMTMLTMVMTMLTMIMTMLTMLTKCLSLGETKSLLEKPVKQNLLFNFFLR